MDMAKLNRSIQLTSYISMRCTSFMQYKGFALKFEVVPFTYTVSRNFNFSIMFEELQFHLHEHNIGIKLYDHI